MFSIATITRVGSQKPVGYVFSIWQFRHIPDFQFLIRRDASTHMQCASPFRVWCDPVGLEQHEAHTLGIFQYLCMLLHSAEVMLFFPDASRTCCHNYWKSLCRLNGRP